jgi:hypothetical protein
MVRRESLSWLKLLCGGAEEWARVGAGTTISRLCNKRNCLGHLRIEPYDVMVSRRDCFNRSNVCTGQHYGELCIMDMPLPTETMEKLVIVARAAQTFEERRSDPLVSLARERFIRELSEPRTVDEDAVEDLYNRAIVKCSSFDASPENLAEAAKMLARVAAIKHQIKCGYLSID